jgi:esterase
MELFYRYYGNGQPFIVLHGVFGVSDNWVSFARRMASDFEIFILDQRNHGRSPHHPVHNYFAMCDDLKEFIDRQQIRNPIILGHSMGGKVAMLFALKNPEIPKALIIADVSLRSYHKRQITEF